MPAANDREQRLQELAAENGYWAEAELNLIETIRQYKRRLAELPGIIQRLNKLLATATAEMVRTSTEHDALEAESNDCPYPCDGCEAVHRIGHGTMLKRDWICPSETSVGWRPIGIGQRLKDAEFRAWANDQADELTDWRETTRRPNY